MRISKMSNILLASCLLLSMLTAPLSAQTTEVTATVDKNPVMVDESFNLTVVANTDANRDDFDPSSLLKDFVVGRTSVSSQTKMINFSTTKSTTWTTVLIPRNKGRFTIPAFDVGGSKTQPISLMVLPVSASNASKGRDLFITTKIDVEQAYLQQQILYTAKLHLGKDLQRGSLSSPTLENADIRQIGKDKEYNEIVDGRRYRIIERSFAIIPQQSGVFTIEGPLFEGEIIDNTRQNFGFFNRSKAVNRIGPNQSITILPVPADYNQHWLPSDMVQVDDEWQGSKNGFVAGEPITRTITLTAIGVVEEQLPDIASQYPQSVKTYPDQAETTTIEKDNTLIAQRKESIAIIPGNSGQLTIPEVRIPWFNIITQKTEYAVLPEKILEVMPSATQPTAAIPDATRPKETPSVDSVPPAIQPNHPFNSAQQYWLWVCLALLLMWLLTLVLWWRHVKTLKAMNSSGHHSSVARTTESEKSQWSKLEKALNKNDIGSIQECLTIWLSNLAGNKKYPLNQSLSAIDNTDLNSAVNDLLSARYSQAQEGWQSTDLHKVARQVRKNWQGTKVDTQAGMSPLYPVS